MRTQLINSCLIAIAAIALSACVVAPRTVGYRVTDTVMPTYVDGQYVGTQPVDYYNSAPVVYQTTTPVYTYDPYYYNPVYVDPWVGFGTGVGIGVGFSNYRGWGGGHHRSWNRGGWNRGGWNRGGVRIRVR